MSPARAASNRLLKEWCAALTGDVLSIGSGSDSDGNGSRYRDYFPQAARYRTSEVAHDPRCDLVLDVRAMPQVETNSIDTVFCSGVLEHVDDCHAAVAECWRVVKAGGSFLVGVPFDQPLHRAPQDFWRFTEFGLRWMLRAFQMRDLVVIGESKHPTTYWAWAVKV
jgi:SAM-dependent methyltransferase